MITQCTSCGSRKVEALPAPRQDGSTLYTDRCTECETLLGVAVRTMQQSKGAQANATGVKQLGSDG